MVDLYIGQHLTIYYMNPKLKWSTLQIELCVYVDSEFCGRGKVKKSGLQFWQHATGPLSRMHKALQILGCCFSNGLPKHCLVRYRASKRLCIRTRRQQRI